VNLLSGLVAAALVTLLVLTAWLRAQGTHERYVLADLRQQGRRLQHRAGALRVEREGLRAELAPVLDPRGPAWAAEHQG